MSSILLTGAGGTLGRPLQRALRAEGHEVLGIDLMHGMTDMRADVRDIRQLHSVMTDLMPDYVFHLAAEFGRHNGEEFYEQCWTTNCVGTRNVIEACKEWKSRLVFASSSEVYGEIDAGVIREDADEGMIRPANDYAISKWANELQIMNAEATSGLEATRLRFFNAYGEGELFHPYRSVVCLFCHNALNGLPITLFEDYHRTFMHIDDFIPTLARAAEPERWEDLVGDAINIGGNDYRSVEELLEIVDGAVGGIDPATVTRLGNDAHNVQSKRPGIELARMRLDHSPTIRLEEGVPRYVEWLSEQEGVRPDAGAPMHHPV